MKNKSITLIFSVLFMGYLSGKGVAAIAWFKVCKIPQTQNYECLSSFKFPSNLKLLIKRIPLLHSHKSQGMMSDQPKDWHSTPVSPQLNKN